MSETIARNTTVSKAQEKKLQEKPGGSNVGNYSNIAPKNLAGTNCGNPGSYPMDTLDRAKSALSYAHNAKNPSCIKNQVYNKWPQLDPKKK